ncbi:cell-cycle control medial ring component domain-containing protein [Trichoderma sp. SZMC 28013]
MAEVAFAKTFLTSLDSRPIKLSPDHIEDPKTFPPRPPYILPRMPTPMTKPSSRLPPGSERSIDITLKSLRNPPLDITLPATPLSTSVLDVKAAVSAQTRIPVDKLKLLLNKRPVADTKVLKELLAKEADRTIDFSVMVIGGAAAIPPEDKKPAGEAMETDEPVATAQADAAAVEAELESDAFWADLGGFLQQRLKAQDKAEELSSLFRSSWQASKSSS